MVRDLEIMVFNEPMPVVRVLAGFIVLMAHGCLRCADAQHSRDLHLTSDAIIGTTWRMKRKRRQQLWAALRVGVSGRDWGGQWLHELSAQGLPGSDYVIQAPCPDLSKFNGKIAK